MPNLNVQMYEDWEIACGALEKIIVLSASISHSNLYALELLLDY